MDDITKNDLPIGFSMELAKNLGALRRFSNLPAAEQKSLVEGARGVNSREEMRAYVSGIELK